MAKSEASEINIAELLTKFQQFSGAVQPTPSGMTSEQGSAFNALAGSAEMAKFVGQMQALIKTLVASGMPMKAIQENLKALGKNSEEASKLLSTVIAKQQTSLADLAKMSPSQFFGNFKNNISSLLKGTLGTMTGEIGAIYGAIKLTYVALSAVGTAIGDVNRQIGVTAMQMGIFQGISPREGTPGFINASGKTSELANLIGRTQATMRQAFHIKPEDTAKMEAALIPHMRRSQQMQFADVLERGQLAPFAKERGVDATIATETFVTLMRRLDLTGGALDRQFKHLVDTAKKTDLSNDEGVQAQMDLWNATRLFGGTLKTAQSDFLAFQRELAKGAVTIQEISGVKGQAANAPIGSIVGLAKMSRGLQSKEGQELYQQLFGGAKTPIELTGAYTQNIGRFGADNLVKLLTLVGHETTGRLQQTRTSYEQTGLDVLAAEFVRQLPGGPAQRTAFQRLSHGKALRGVPIGGMEGAGVGAVLHDTADTMKTDVDTAIAAQRLFHNVFVNTAVDYLAIKDLMLTSMVAGNLDAFKGKGSLLKQTVLDTMRITPVLSIIGQISNIADLGWGRRIENHFHVQGAHTDELTNALNDSAARTVNEHQVRHLKKVRSGK